jgi:transposase
MVNIKLPLDIESLEIIDQKVDSDGKITLTVKSKKDFSICHKCQKPATKPHGTAPVIMVQHTSILDRPVYLKIEPLRYQCKDCENHPTTTEQYDWCARNAKVTHALESYLMRCLINSTVQDVSIKTKVGYKTIVRAINRLVNKKVDWSVYKDIQIIGIDDITIKKGYQDFVSIISARSKNGNITILAVIEGREKADVLAFFNSIPAHLRKTVKHVCADMYEGYVNAATEVFGRQAVVIDRYHVAKQYRKPLDDLRIKEMKRLKTILSDDDYSNLNGMMWILRKKHECLSVSDKSKLALLYKYSPVLKRAHSFALKLTHIFNTHQNRKSGMAKFDRWINSVNKSQLTCFNTFISTLEKHKSCIANYFKQRANSGFVEGLNNKIKVIKRRCYGFFKTESLFQRLHLDLIGFNQYALQLS